MKLLSRFRECQSGATAIEYALVAGLVSIVIVSAASITGSNLQTLYSSISDKIDKAINP